MIGKVIPTRRRGIFFGLADGGGLLMGVIGAYFVGRALDLVDYPGSFALLFLVAGLIHAVSWFSLSLTREPASEVVKQATPLRHYFRRLPALLRGHANYRRFLVAYALLRLSMMAVSFFIVFGNINFDLTGADIGLLNAIFIGSQAVLRLLFGWLGDRWGHKRNLAISASSMALASLFALASNDVAGLIPAFICLACAISSDMVSHANILLEFAAPADQPTYIGLTNTLMAPFTFVGPVIAGWLADAFDISLLFFVSLGFGVLGAGLLWRWVQEPRQQAK